MEQQARCPARSRAGQPPSDERLALRARYDPDAFGELLEALLDEIDADRPDLREVDDRAERSPVRRVWREVDKVRREFRDAQEAAGER